MTERLHLSRRSNGSSDEGISRLPSATPDSDELESQRLHPPVLKPTTPGVASSSIFEIPDEGSPATSRSSNEGSPAAPENGKNPEVPVPEIPDPEIRKSQRLPATPASLLATPDQTPESFRVILLPIAITFYITWWFIHFVDGFFSPIYTHLGINVFGLGFVTSISFIFLMGVFMSSWLGASVLGLGEWFIRKMPFVSLIYSASKQISAAISPDQNSQAFKGVAIIRHPRIGEYAFGFITSTVFLQRNADEEELCCVYVPSNHLYIGDVFLINSKEIIRPNLSVREGLEIVLSGGVSIPQILQTVEVRSLAGERGQPVKSPKLASAKY